MCLTKLRKLPKISFKPITVYKAFDVKIIKDSNTEYIGLMSPYFGEKYNKEGDVIKVKKFELIEMLLCDTISGCGVHAYDDINCIKWNNIAISHNFALVKCTIPKFTLYWEGRNNEIAARKIKIGKIIFTTQWYIIDFILENG